MKSTNGAHPLLYLDAAEGVSDFFSEISPDTVVALDTEGASFHRFVDRVYLIQVTAADRTAIIDPLAMQAPPGLGEVVTGADHEVVFHDADYDLRLLHQDYGWEARRVFDTRIAAQLAGIRAFGLGTLLEQLFGVRLDKKHQRADWSMRPLTDDMLQYAAMDTRYLVDLRDELAGKLATLGRTEWAREEFERLEGIRWDDSEDDNAFLRLKGARDLTRPQLAVLRELVQWRESVARDLDRAVFRVIGNEVLLELSRSDAATLDAIGRMRGVPRGLLARRGEELLDALRRGRATPQDKLPRFPRALRYDKDSAYEDRVKRLRAVRDAAAQRLDLDPGVLCPRDRLEAVARMVPTSLEQLSSVPDMRRWQVAELGLEMLEAAGG